MAAGYVNRTQKKTKGYGWHIVIDHGSNLQTLYAHLSAFNVQPNQPVTAGTVIGYSGNTGNSTGPHVHIEALRSGKQFDFLPYLTADIDADLPTPPPLDLPEIPAIPVFSLTVNGLRLRSQPSTTAPILTYMNAGTQLHIIDIQNIDGDLWAQVGHNQYCALRWHGNIYGKFEETTL